MKPEEWDKIAEEYFDNLSSPFEGGVKNPLFGIVKSMGKKKSMSVVDLGTGIGNLIPFLESNFGSVAAVDFSEKMLELAKKKSKTKKVEFMKKDMRNLKGLYNKFDAAFAINSFLAPSVRDINKMITETRKILKKNGKLFAVFPSLESVLYKAMLTYEHERKTKSRKKAKKETRKRIEKRKYDFLLGFMNESGEQKHFYKFEIEYRLKQAGFHNIKFEKIEYPWSLWEERYLLKFREKPRMWDWIVTANK
jgi:ubiquinone/menaquinone biosynthesis C-methylase UbiE